MKIRSVTCFYNPASPSSDHDLVKAGNLAKAVSSRLQNRGFEIQTTRLATTPFPLFLNSLEPLAAIPVIQELEAKAAEQGFSYLSIGPALPVYPESYPLVIEILSNTRNVFVTAMMTDGQNIVSLDAVRDCAEVIFHTAGIRSEGFANLNFAAMANVRPFAPFFPAAYQQGDQVGFALAIECADLALTTFTRGLSLAAARDSLLKTLEDYARVLSAIAEEAAIEFDVIFHGIDYSLAPYPQAWCSIGSALERLGPVNLGLSGSLASAAFVADLLDRGKWKRTGFNGLMLPVLEDTTLAQRSAEGTLTIRDLLLFSAVCGTGLDTVPLPGNITVDQLNAILLDVAALSTRLDKQLTARLMPIPEKVAGDPTDFKFSFFSNGKVLQVYAAPLRGQMAEDHQLELFPHKRT